MWIKLGNQLVNLDMIQRISPVIQLQILKDHNGNEESYAYIMEEDDDLENRSKDKSHARFEWMFQLEYINKERITVMGTVQVNIMAAQVELLNMLNANKPPMPVISIESDSVNPFNFTQSNRKSAVFYYTR